LKLNFYAHNTIDPGTDGGAEAPAANHAHACPAPIAAADRKMVIPQHPWRQRRFEGGNQQCQASSPNWTTMEFM
jgi:hypothetical protein